MNKTQSMFSHTAVIVAHLDIVSKQ